MVLFLAVCREPKWSCSWQFVRSQMVLFLAVCKETMVLFLAVCKEPNGFVLGGL